MDIFDQKEVLKSFQILVDSREQATERAEKRYKSFSAPYSRATLDYGDYTYNAVLPDGSSLFNICKTIKPFCVVERKMNLDELATCFTRGRERFKREFERALDQKCRIYLICENSSWENLLNSKYRSKFNSNAFLASSVAWMVRYNMNVVFCKEETSGRLIKEILYRDLKERLERGELDGCKFDSTHR